MILLILFLQNETYENKAIFRREKTYRFIEQIL